MRQVHLVGSVPLRPAANVFETVIEHLRGLVCRIPDGEQRGWLLPIWEHLANNDALEVVKQVPINPHAGVNLPVYRLRAGRSTDEVVFGPYGIAHNALASYAQFRELRAAGTIPQAFAFKLPCPGRGPPSTRSRFRPMSRCLVPASAVARGRAHPLGHPG